jgi:hypothetical protein
VSSDDQIDRARTDRYEAIAGSAEIQAAAHRAKSAGTVALITNDPARQQAAADAIAEVDELLVRAGADQDVVGSWTAFKDATEETAAATFDQFRASVETLLQDDQAEFLGGLDDARRSLRWLSLGTLALGLLAAATALIGFQARINEYW